MRELGLRLLGRQEPDPGPLLLAGLGQHELRAALEAQAESGRLRPFLSRLQIAQAPGRHQVDEQDELAVLGREEQPFRATLGSGQAPPLQRRQRRVDRLQRRDVRRPGLLDRKAETGSFQLPAPGLHLG